MMLRPVLCLIIINKLFLLSFGMAMLGPADLIFQSFEHCDQGLTEMDVKITRRKYNRTTNVLDIVLSTPFTLDDRVELEMKSSVKKEGGYKPGGFYLKDKICKVLRTMLGDVFSAFLKVAGRDDCPIPEGTYEILEFYLDNDAFKVPSIYGEHKVETNIFRDEDQLSACYNLYVDVVPKG